MQSSGSYVRIGQLRFRNHEFGNVIVCGLPASPHDFVSNQTQNDVSCACFVDVTKSVRGGSRSCTDMSDSPSRDDPCAKLHQIGFISLHECREDNLLKGFAKIFIDTCTELDKTLGHQVGSLRDSLDSNKTRHPPYFLKARLRRCRTVLFFTSLLHCELFLSCFVAKNPQNAIEQMNCAFVFFMSTDKYIAHFLVSSRNPIGLWTEWLHSAALPS